MVQSLRAQERHLVTTGPNDPARGFSVERRSFGVLHRHQDVIQWGIRADDLGLDDPPVYLSSVDDPNAWLTVNDSVSEFALQMFAFCIKWWNQRRWWANACVTPDVVERVTGIYPRLPLAQWDWPGPNQFYGYRDILVDVEDHLGHGYAWLHVATRTAVAAEASQKIVGPLSVQWNTASDDWPMG